jgi:hypothetical protein
MAAITQIRHKRSQGRAYYDRKLAEGKTHKEALRALKRRISDATYAALAADARQAASAEPSKGPGGQPGNRSVSRAAGSHPKRRLFGSATPGPATTLRPGATAGPAPEPPNRAHQRRTGHSAAASKKPSQPLDTASKEDSLCTASGRLCRPFSRPIIGRSVLPACDSLASLSGPLGRLTGPPARVGCSRGGCVVITRSSAGSSGLRTGQPGRWRKRP